MQRIEHLVVKLLDAEGSELRIVKQVQAEGVWDILLQRNEFKLPDHQRHRLLGVIGSKEEVIRLAELCLGHPAEIEAWSRWEIRPSEFKVEDLDSKKAIDYIEDLSEALVKRMP